MIELYTAPTPNGHKVSICLEELCMPYEVHAVDLAKGEHKRADYLKLNPNARIPTIVDRQANDFPVFESGAILVYLAEKAGSLMPKDVRGRSQVMQWLMFQMGGIGPMMGQAIVFYRYFPQKIAPAIERYQNETRRLFEVLDARLQHSEWLAQDYSIADIANWAWVRNYKWAGVSIEGLSSLMRWNDAMYQRPACKRGIEVPFKLPKLNRDPEAYEQFIRTAQSSVQR